MIGYILYYRALNGQGKHCSIYIKVIERFVKSIEPICFEIYYGNFKRGTRGQFDVDSIIRKIDPYTEFQCWHSLKIDKIKDYIDIIQKNNNISFEKFMSITGVSQFENDRVFSKLKQLDLLSDPDPTHRIYALDFSNLELWTKYNCSDFWKKYYESDKIKKKYEKLGINYDELDYDYDSMDGD